MGLYAQRAVQLIIVACAGVVGTGLRGPLEGVGMALAQSGTEPSAEGDGFQPVPWPAQGEAGALPPPPRSLSPPEDDGFANQVSPRDGDENPTDGAPRAAAWGIPAAPDAFSLRPLVNYTSFTFALASQSARFPRYKAGASPDDPPELVGYTTLTKYILSPMGTVAFADDWQVELRLDLAIVGGGDSAVFFQGGQTGLRYRVFQRRGFTGVVGAETEFGTLSFRRFRPDFSRTMPYTVWGYVFDEAAVSIQAFVGVNTWVFTSVAAKDVYGPVELWLPHGLNVGWMFARGFWVMLEPGFDWRLYPTDRIRFHAYMTPGFAWRTERVSASIGLRFPLNHRGGQNTFEPVVRVAIVF